MIRRKYGEGDDVDLDLDSIVDLDGTIRPTSTITTTEIAASPRKACDE